MSNDFKVGDRVISTTDPNILNSDFHGLIGTIVEEGARPRVTFDKKADPPSNKGWGMPERSITRIDEGPTEEEIAELFMIGPKPPGPDSTQVELLEHIDRALRGGKLVRANLAFEFLLKSLNLTRLDLPSYVHDMQEDK